MMKTHFIAALAFLLVCAGCEFIGLDSSDSEDYSYTAYDSTGTAVVRGTLELRFIEVASDGETTHRIEGRRDLERVGDDAVDVGPQVGNGELAGSVDLEGDIWIDLNSGIADDNVILRSSGAGAHFSDLEGEWMHLTFGGVSSRGTFEIRD